MPDVPNWLLWLATISTLVVISWGIVKYLWRQWLSDLWAKRTQDSAADKAAILVRQYREAFHLADNDRRFQAISTMVVSDLIGASIMMAIGGSIIVVIANDLILMSKEISILTFSVGAILIWLGLLLISEAMDKRQRFIKPYIDWVKYHETTLDRIRSLLAKTGLNDGEQAIFIDGIVDVVEEDLIELGEDDTEDYEQTN